MINIDDFLDIDLDVDIKPDDGVDIVNVSNKSASTDDIKDEIISIRDSPVLEIAVGDDAADDDVIVITDDHGEVMDTITRFPTLGSMCGMDFGFDSLLPENLICFGNYDLTPFSPKGFKSGKQ